MFDVVFCNGHKGQPKIMTDARGLLPPQCRPAVADIVGIPMHRQANPRNHNVLGMGFLAFSRLGKLDLTEVPGMIKFDRIFEPDPKKQPVYDRLYGIWSEARLQGSGHRGGRLLDQALTGLSRVRGGTPGRTVWRSCRSPGRSRI